MQDGPLFAVWTIPLAKKNPTPHACGAKIAASQRLSIVSICFGLDSSSQRRTPSDMYPTG